ncbi:hypothetical protein CGRA01v4_01896 [Colletotrichum graminicola]|nr:hypothetical protein CGRA01v4_01896 [Colletotrichum graminicola]
MQQLSTVQASEKPAETLPLLSTASKVPYQGHHFHGNVLGFVSPFSCPRGAATMPAKTNSGGTSDADRLWPSPNPFSELAYWGCHGPAPQFQSPRLGPIVPCLSQYSTYSRMPSIPNVMQLTAECNIFILARFTIKPSIKSGLSFARLELRIAQRDGTLGCTVSQNHTRAIARRSSSISVSDPCVPCSATPSDIPAVHGMRDGDGA